MAAMYSQYYSFSNYHISKFLSSSKIGNMKGNEREKYWKHFIEGGCYKAPTGVPKAKELFGLNSPFKG